MVVVFNSTLNVKHKNVVVFFFNSAFILKQKKNNNRKTMLRPGGTGECWNIMKQSV